VKVVKENRNSIFFGESISGRAVNVYGDAVVGFFEGAKEFKVGLADPRLNVEFVLHESVARLMSNFKYKREWKTGSK
jgi:hypothetical protein